MLLDLLDTSNSIIVNLDMIKCLGLTTAVYCSELISIYNKANRKHKLVNNAYFKVDRKYVENITGINIEDQLSIDNKLIKLDILKLSSDETTDILTLDIDLLTRLVTSEDETTINNIKKAASKKSRSEQTKAKKQVIINNLKATITIANEELKTALDGWVDALYAKPNGFLTKAMVQTFQHDLNSFTKGDLDVALDVIKIATSQGYSNCQWAIDSYNRGKHQYFQNAPRVVEQKKADISTINTNISF